MAKFFDKSRTRAKSAGYSIAAALFAVGISKILLGLSVYYLLFAALAGIVCAFIWPSVQIVRMRFFIAAVIMLFFYFYGEAAPYAGGVFMSASLIFLISTRTVPALIEPVVLFVDFLIKIIGNIVGFLSLFVLYYLIFVPIGFILRLGKHTLLQTDIERDSKSYWHIREKIIDKKAYFQNQY